MSSLKKLMIRGIRSFSHRESNTLEFYSPLTLIVGANGTGKTTIIESLKYISTGSLPPNSRGGAFIYDPKVAGLAEVQGSVKLLFTNVHGETMVCTRSMQLTQRRGKREQKTLESVVWAERDGGGVSGRSGDVDAEMPQHFGVSSSVLENIIFCHQEESTWPLGEPVVVKKKLDEIFASAKYGKALDSLKSSKKECASDIKMKMQELEFLRKMKERKECLEARIKSGCASIERNEAKLEAYGNEIRRCEDVVEEINVELRNNEEAERRAYMLRNEHEELKRFIDGFKEKALPLEEAKGILSGKLLTEAEKRYERIRAEAEESEARFRCLSERRSAYLKDKTELDGVFSEISVKSSLLDEARRQREEVFKSLESELLVTKDFRETAAEAFKKVEEDIRRRKESIEVLESELLKLRKEDENKMKILSEKKRIVDEYRDLVYDESMDLSVSYEEEIERLRIEIETDREMEALEERLEEYQRRLNNAYSIAERNFAMNQIRSRKKEIEKTLKEVNVPELRAKLERQREELREKERRMKKIEREMNLRRAEIARRERENDKIRKDIKMKTIELGAMIQKSDTPTFEGLGISRFHGESRHRVKEAKEMVKGNGDFFTEDIMMVGVEVLDPEGLYNGKEAQLLSGENEGLYRKKIYREILEEGSRCHRCPICDRSFSIEEEVGFKRRLEMEIEEALDGKENGFRNLKGMDDVCKAIEGLNEGIMNRNRLREEIIELILRYEPLGDSVDSEVLEEMELDILDEAEGIKKTEYYIGLVSELFLIDGKLKDEEEGESVQELKSMIDGVRKIYEDKKREMKEKRERIGYLEQKQGRIRAEEDVRGKIGLRKEAERAIEQIERSDLKARISEVSEEILRRKGKVDKVFEKFSRKRVELEMNMEVFYQKEKEVRHLEKEVEELNGKVKKLLQAEYGEEVKDETKFDSVRNDLLEKKNEVLEVGRKIRMMHEVRGLAEESIRYYNRQKRVEEIERELSETDFEYLIALKEKKKLLEEKKMNLVSQQSLLLGECKQIALGIKSCKQELLKDHSRTVEDYNKCFIELKALELSCLDLDKCIQALDRAIIDFHTSKLEEVNATLKDLWESTYKGDDVDWIEIKTESLGQKTYNYKVVFIKGGVELDMRGRSSSGQKMIASILIRLALANSFASNCNILALDEPTTNLDRDNIESLAFTLSRVISRHKENSDFQLIVITHDEDFVQLLSRDGPEYFYKLNRNENGDSVIVRHSVYGMQESGMGANKAF
ncbi:Rad50-like protein [Encephalitozoon hellem ATCC 50504]|uniref:DNA repair protein Rad50 n=1 Tax=Encephalitozoon hellem TaxID=27973 RepID=A0A9Q9C3L2_ENCHE|nr:Rad50-like protein [Encephalitozoon hellem ATCC 50504]AFM98585.1 Rad50-like protein [Encephalitozoon hellem ATCC 50504]UTX43529.1 DNA repair protein Rad50 [Encephalitozoon hellem]|eukprot:XP_003887566.1 Rad50-like protein [Encephalitozoon hellem ATCC 50504]